MRTHSITLDDETSVLARQTRNFSQFVRNALRAEQNGSTIALADLTNRRRLALALYAVDSIIMKETVYGEEDEPYLIEKEKAEQCRALLVELMKIA